MVSHASQNATKVHGFDKDFRINHHDIARSFSTRKPQLRQLPFSKAWLGDVKVGQLAV